MRIFGERQAEKFGRKYASGRKALERFLRTVHQAEWNHLPDIKQSFPMVDYTPSGRFVFDIGGNKYRLIATINFGKQAFLIESILTHEEYGRKDL